MSMEQPLSTGPLQYAGFWRRLLALLLDALITFIPLMILLMIPTTILTMSGVNKAVIQMVGNLDSMILQWLYCALMESSPTQGTLGKMICKIKVTDLGGNRISFARASGRYFAKTISALLLFGGYIMAGFTEKRQALHDMIAGTLVVRGETETAPR